MVILGIAAAAGWGYMFGGAIGALGTAVVATGVAISYSLSSL